MKNDLRIYQDNLELSKERIELLKEKDINIDYFRYKIDLICKITELYKNCKKLDSKRYFYNKSSDILLKHYLPNIK